MGVSNTSRFGYPSRASLLRDSLQAHIFKTCAVAFTYISLGPIFYFISAMTEAIYVQGACWPSWTTDTACFA